MEMQGKELNNDSVSREEYDKLLQMYNNLKHENSELNDRVQWLLEQLTTANRDRFGSKSAKASEEVTGQMTLLFDEPEMYAYLESVKESRTTVAAHERVRKEKTFLLDNLPSNIPVQIIEHRLSGNELLCSNCGSEMVEIGKDVVRTLDIVPAQFVVHEDRYFRYACKSCEKENCKTVIAEAPKIHSFYPGSYASPKSVAYLMYQKYIMGSPLYRMEKDCERSGIPLSRQTMSNWMIYASENWLTPIYDELHKMLLKKYIINADETTVQVLREPGRKAQTDSYMWLYRSGQYEEHPIILYEYCDGRSKDNPEKFLEGFEGKYLQTDGYAGYNGIDVTHVGCLAHLKRKFHDAVEVLPKDRRTGAAVDGEAYCDYIFKLEREINSKNPTPEERYSERQERIKPVFDEFLAWGNTRSASSKSKLGIALTYLKNQGAKIENYLLDGRLEISNNLAERSIKMFVIDRKNFLFANTPAGATSSAVTFSIIQTAIENGLDPYKYLEFIFKEGPVYKSQSDDWVNKVLPENAPDYCRVKEI